MRAEKAFEDDLSWTDHSMMYSTGARFSVRPRTDQSATGPTLPVGPESARFVEDLPILFSATSGDVSGASPGSFRSRFWQSS